MGRSEPAPAAIWMEMRMVRLAPEENIPLRCGFAPTPEIRVRSTLTVASLSRLSPIYLSRDNGARACEGGGGGRTRAQEPEPGARDGGRACARVGGARAGARVGGLAPAAARPGSPPSARGSSGAHTHCNTLKFLDFRMLRGRIIKQRFVIILKFVQHLFFFTGNLV
jgi:hypothetical protein